MSSHDFPQYDGITYLDSAATSLTPHCVIDAINDYYTKGRGTVHRAVYSLAAEASALHHSVREKAAQFINASPDEIVFTKGTTDGLNLLAACFTKQLKDGDEILISQMEHHSNIVPWQMLAQNTGATLKVIPVTADGDLDMAAFDQLLNERTKLISIAHMTNVTGTIYPIEEVIAKAHAKGALVIIDGAQAAPHTPIDVQALDADFYLFSGHKLYGPTGVGVLYGKYDLLDALPPYQGGSDMIDQVSFEHTTYQKPPLKFEAGTPAISSIIGLGAAFDFVASMRDKIRSENAITDYALAELQSIEDVTILGNPAKRGPLISFSIEGMHPLDLGTLLDLKGFCVRTGHLCAQPTMEHFGISQAMRISFGVYTTRQEIDRFMKELQCLKSTILA